MKEKILIGIICGLILIVIGIGVYVAITPTVETRPLESDVSEIKFPDNQLPKLLGINRPAKRIPRIFAIRNYNRELIKDEINSIKALRYYIIDSQASGHLLVLPFETGGRIIVSKMIWDDYEEKYVESTNETDVIINEQITPGYGLLLKYDRPLGNKYDLQIKVIEGNTTATYAVEPQGDSNNKIEFDKIQYIQEDGYDPQ